MSMDQTEFIKIIKKLGLEKDIFKGNFGLEKENIRVDRKGRLALTPHPETFGNKLKNPYITTDFSESQVEMITPISDTIEDCYNFLDSLHNIVSLELRDEYLWPQSMPPELPEDDELIPIARYDNSYDGRTAQSYREEIGKIYGRKKQLISGIHYNFSFKDEFLKKIHREVNRDISFNEFKNWVYLRISRNLLRYRWLLVYLFGASVGMHESYGKKCIDGMISGNDGYYIEHATSFRNGICGYRNMKDYQVSYESLSQYISDLENLIKNGDLKSIKEYYGAIRLKGKDNKNILESLKKNGIEYLELRILDLNPFLKNGIDPDSLYMVHLILLLCLFKEETEGEENEASSSNYESSATMGRMENLSLKSKTGAHSLKEWGIEVLDEISSMIHELDPKRDYLEKIVEDARGKILDPKKTVSHKILEGVMGDSFVGFHMKKAEEHLELSTREGFKFSGYEDLELSTQILLKEAIKRGLKFDIMDRDENFILLDDNLKKEYIIQATKTSLDSYATVLIMENKLVTKKIMTENGVHVPEGGHYRYEKDALESMELYKDKKIVIKPKSTNFGIGITIFKDGFSRSDFKRAVEIAFEHDKSILIEEFVEGKEYRFLVIGDEVAGVLHRVPANVTGDGVKNIRELVDEKNRDPLRGKGYKTPLEKINLGESEEIFLKSQGKDFEYVPSLDETVYLRENSNISTGGDSIDFTGIVPVEYEKIAVNAAKLVGAKICGVDIVIKNIEEGYRDENYAIIELNFNPAIHMHCYPYKGENRKIGDKILDLLGYHITD